MELLQLRYFRTAAKFENFSKAAAYHMIPQSAISKTIKRLEQELNCQLFDRNGKNISLNTNGKAFLKNVDKALNTLDDGINKLKEEEPQIISIQIVSGVRIADKLISYIKRTDPHLKIVLYQGESKEGITSDFNIVQLPIDTKIYDYFKLADEEIMVAIHKKNPLSKKHMIQLSDLQNEKFITYDSNNPLRIFIDDYCKQNNFSPNIIFEAHSVDSFRSMIDANLGIAFVPSSSWNSVESKDVKLIPIKDHPMRQLVVAWDKDKEINDSYHQFSSLVKKWIEENQD
ncbi:DNA-binding transcriptional regulator, LysR family [Pseudobutyrivibrio sp. ACV-2]|uniref:LysR family transcriptional regulator n=1 Tax=Pseudobutyrivibrio sp. ACV-2 TaxID=1520801 RepID=UPI00089C7068|nr:LysR family transcriptional regulator [Pseudobutyrivibrio sp. ACV-2]SEA99824.1 DNA-binding transcriptional regulator, LysR family [Pseudobutyrivibrio sp. ACV-2]